MKTPAFWSKDSWVSSLLTPASLIYEIITHFKNRIAKPVKIQVSVLCIGGLTAGGAGKTPVCLHIGELCKERGIDAWFLSRGYKGNLQGPIQVKPSEHTAHDVGDEPLLLAGVLPTVIAKDRVLGAQFAAKAGAKLIIMDDGFQNPTIHKDVSIVVVDGMHLFGNGRLIPAGPLRERMETGLKRADAIILINPVAGTTLPAYTRPALRAHTKPNGDAFALKGKKIIAFCGLAYPQKFFSTLSALGANIIEQRIFPDHYQYSDAEIDTLALKAKEQEAVLVTTSKDAARMNKRSLSLVTVVYVTLEFEHQEALMALLEKVFPTS